MWPIFKVFTEFVTILLVSGFTLPLALEGKVSTSGLPGKPRENILNLKRSYVRVKSG